MHQYNNEQYQAVRHTDGPMLVLAGPGSGKTQVIAGRVLNLIRDEGADPSTILVLTFSKAAAMEMRTRFLRESRTEYPVTFGTFHAIFYHIIKSQGLYGTGIILAHKRKTELLRITAMRQKIDRYADAVWVERMLALIHMKKAGLDDCVLSDEEETWLESIYEPYMRLCRTEEGIDFDDMINECLKALKGNDKILKKWQDRYRYILVDEFQDIDRRQYEALMLLSREHRNLFCVGDDDQAIYSFRGASPEMMRKMTQDMTDTRICRLKINYRCPPCVIEHAGKLIGLNRSRFEKEQESNDASKKGRIVYKSVETSEEEASVCFGIIRDILSSDIHGERRIGVLYRTAGSADMTENRLRHSLIGYTRRDSRSKKRTSEWEEDIAAYLRLAAGDAEGDLLRILNRPERGLTRECVFGRYPDRKLVEGYYAEGSDERKKTERLFKDIDRIGELNGFGALNYILRVTGLGEYIRNSYFSEKTGEEYEKAMEELKALAGECSTAAALALRLCESHPGKSHEDKEQYEGDGKSRVELMTIHASKGLEFDDVIMIGLQEGLFPGKGCISEREIEEERRLFYVAMTRCRENLWIIGHNKDNYGKRQSRFIKEAGIGNETADPK